MEKSYILTIKTVNLPLLVPHHHSQTQSQIVLKLVFYEFSLD